MPWHIGKSKQCPSSKPFAVIKDDGGKVMGCHESEEKAKKQLAALHVAEDRRMGRLEELWNKFTDALLAEITVRAEGTVEEQPHYLSPTTTRSMVQRQEDGRYRLFSISAVSALNRVGEIDSRELFDSFVAIWREKGKNPQRDFMHMGHYSDAFITGEVDFMERVGNTLVTSTLYNDSELAEAEILARQHAPEKWGDSISYLPIEESVEEVDGESIPVIKAGYLKFVATLPERMAASVHTKGTIQEVGRMAKMNEQSMAAMVLLWGDAERAQTWLDENVDDIEAALEMADVLTRSVEDEPVEDEVVESEPEVEDVVEPEVVEREFELDDETVDAIITRMIESGRLEGFAEGMAKRLAGIEERLETLEADEDDKHRQWAGDMPRREIVRPTYRPRSDNAPENGGTVDSMAQQAESAVDGWNTDEYKNAVRE